MDSDYDRKFEEMKKYIPFLESMIKRLESTGTGPFNPRLAQLNKIRSLRDLLSDKKKRMRMENLLKCEQVLLNLHAKVEQGNALPIDTPLPSEKENLETVRSKLKKVAAKLGNESAETLPEIARASDVEEVCASGSKQPALFQKRIAKASEIEEVCASGSKQPALFQTRPHTSSQSPIGLTPIKSDSNLSPKPVPKRNYTRVLQSPDRSEDRPLYRRRSPRPKSPRSSSESYRKERKHSYQSNRRDSSSTKSKTRTRGLNITLNVPEERLHSINTEDILTRIINCHGSDVDIDTLKDLRSQIISELKHTGAHDDITHLLLNSYKKTTKKKDEVEDGEICDSDNEAIESIYGSLVTVDKAKNTSTEIKTSSTDKRRVQICLRIDADKDASKKNLKAKQVLGPDYTDFQSFDIDNSADSKSKITVKVDENNVVEGSQPKDIENETKTNPQKSLVVEEKILSHRKEQPIVSDCFDITNDTNKKEEVLFVNDCFDITNDTNIPEETMSHKPKESLDPAPYKPNFYKPLNEKDNQTTDSMSIIGSLMKISENVTDKKPESVVDVTKAKNTDTAINKDSNTKDDVSNVINSTKETKPKVDVNEPSINSSKESKVVEIPLLNEEPVVPKPPPKAAVSEIDILQALKNEILGESISIQGSENVTPALHQPKFSKVENAQTITSQCITSKVITSKKRISIETYKEKATGSPKHRISNKARTSLDDSNKKQSLKLTEKECERFNFPPRLSLDSSDDDCDDNFDIYNVFGPQAPKSPEKEEMCSTDSTPIIIPVDPVKTPIISHKLDIDMRKLPLLSSSAPKPVPPPILSPISDGSLSLKQPEQVYIPPLVDPRLKRDVNMPFNMDILNYNSRNPDRTPRSSLPNMTPSRAPNMTPNSRTFEPNMTPNSRTFEPNMTPNSRTFEMTPSRQFNDFDDNSGKSHVYAPLFTSFDKDRETSVNRDIVPVWDREKNDSSNDSRNTNQSRKWEDPRSSSNRDNSRDYNKSNYIRNDRYKIDTRDSNQSQYSPALSRLDCPTTPVASFGRMETPTTPVHPFGRSDCPRTPSHPYGRSDCPPTSTHSFGRSDMPLTPSHPFGRSDAPITPTHPFGRSDGPMIPGHPFGRSDAPMTPSHPFGRSDYTQNTLGKVNKDPRLNRSYEERDRGYCDKRKSDSSNQSYQGYDQEESQERYEKPYEKGGHPYNRDRSYRERSVGRTNSKDYEPEQYCRRNNRPKDYNYEREGRRSDNDSASRVFQREQSVGRSDNFYQSSPITSSNKSNVSKLSVTPQTGRSFTIDTSVSRTFQEFLEEKGIKLDYPVAGTRKERATSVGRSLARESSVGRSFRESSVGRTFTAETSNLIPKKNIFERARSVGRELSEKGGKTLNEIKADFKSFRSKYNSKQEIKKPQIKKIKSPIKSNYVPLNIKPNKQKNTYSPRKNNRDPRMHRDRYNENSKRRDSKESDRKKYGIDYSHDNIAKGTILGSGYGVKNYKIPKIKRPVEEKIEDISHTDSKNENVKVQENNVPNKKTDKTDSDKGKTQKSKKTDETKKSHENIEKRPTRSIAKEKVETKFEKYERAVKAKKSKKLQLKPKPDKENKVAIETKVSPEINKNDDNILDDHFNEIFPESLESDQSEDLSELIAGLEKEIDNSKTTNPDITTKDSVFDSLFENSSALSEAKQTVEESLDDLHEFINKDLNKPLKKTEQISSTDVITPLRKDNSEINLKSNKNEIVCEKPISNKDVDLQTKQTQDTHTIVSTTDAGKELDKKDSVQDSPSLNYAERSSTPDSTINNDELTNVLTKDKKIPDSTDDLQKEMHSDVTSTHDSSENTASTHQPAKVDSPQADNSIGNLLSILQDKSKIRELLSMLGDQENEKIKKKLEKLSEIVESDEEETPAEVSKGEDDEKEKESMDGRNQHDEEYVSDNITQPADQDETQDKSLETHGIDTSEAIAEGLTNKVLSPKPKKRTLGRKGKGRLKKGKNNTPSFTGKRVTRSNASLKNAKKKQSRELRLLQNDIKEMFISDEILKATGIRMCRLAKLVDEKVTNQEDDNQPEPGNVNKPVVVLEKISVNNQEQPTDPVKNKTKKKPVKQTSKTATDNQVKTTKKKQKIGPKSKIERQEEDSYGFDDSLNDKMANTSCSESENESLTSFKSVGSSDVLTEAKKKMKRKRNAGWKAGVISTKKRKKVDKDTKTVESEIKEAKTLRDENVHIQLAPITIPDINCFTDKTYCFLKNISTYSCRLCHYSGGEIVHHYKRCHPHSEIPLSRMSPEIAKQAIEQSDEIDFQAVSKVLADKYTCRFCFKEYVRVKNKNKNNIEAFFWHVVSTHTGEYKQLCSECINVTRCPFNLDIPPPPKDVTGQLIGYICAKCNFTQISLENLKTHVIVRHNDEQTAVYTINLSTITKKTMKAIMQQSTVSESIEHRVLRSSRSNQSTHDTSDNRSELSGSSENISEIESLKMKLKEEFNIKDSPQTNSKTKIMFESDEALDPETVVKAEPDDTELDSSMQFDDVNNDSLNDKSTDKDEEDIPPAMHTPDFKDCIHFKIVSTPKGTQEYVCCVNGEYNHFKTHLLILMKKHVQLKHQDNWDGYCSICKVIVTAQGPHTFKECLQHYVDKHRYDFLESEVPTNQVAVEIESVPEVSTESSTDNATTTKSFINVRPLSELITTTPDPPDDNTEVLPIIESVVSLGNVTAPAVTSTSLLERASPSRQVKRSPEFTLYEEAQRLIMTRKNKVVLDTMLTPEKLVNIFKCAGRFCCFATDSMEDALQHASAHIKLGGENSLKCAYCDYDCAENAINLVVHIFKYHGSCQYSCSKCFYRSAGSHLVYAHIIRMHKGEGAHVLETTTVTPSPDEASELLSREESVMYYICANSKTCGHKSYAQGKFCELLMRHPPPYKCYLCAHSEETPVLLLDHMRSHNMSRLQCTWCGQGADNEAALVNHSSVRHPHRQPQAYIRVITIKNPNKLTVLPLAKYINSSVKTTIVTSTNRTNPILAVERAIELEQLIGSLPISGSAIDNEGEQPNLQTETNTPVQANTSVISKETGDLDISVPNVPEDDEPIPSFDQEPTIVTLADIEPRLETPPPSTSHEEPAQLSLVVKTEPIVDTSKKIDSDVIYCLDSDEEDTPTVSGTNPPAFDALKNVVKSNTVENQIRKVNLDVLHTCPKCLKVFINMAGLKNHYMRRCLVTYTEELQCPHCGITKLMDDLFRHFVEHNKTTHSKTNVLYACEICDKRHASLALIKTHIFKEHGQGKTTIKKVMKDHGEVVHSVVLTPSRTPAKRKLSGGNLESPSKKKYYGPLDINELPPKPILDNVVHCTLCEFNSKVRLNMVRHLQQHANKQPVAQTVPVNPVPHLETNEKHFDKMINLASSSLVTRPEKTPTETTPSVRILVPAEQASRYPKYVPERQRLTCGAAGCSYTSVDEAMLKYHWETLHTGTTNYHCHHCPPYQYLDTSKPLTSSRVIAHLKMHDANLYACSACAYYHYKKPVVEKHLMVVHKGSGQAMIVREEYTESTQTVPSTSAAPTMDLKPWQCGLCKYKNMLRQEVIEHCSRTHNTKMQFKCPNCPMKTSTLENITNHRSNRHPGSSDDVIYYYYREGTVPDGSDGTPLWVKQRAIMGVVSSDLKSEVDPPADSSTICPPNVPINLDIVKQEVEDIEMPASVQTLAQKFGEFCEPDGLKYKCPLCKVVTMDNKGEFQSHLFEELKYRKWGCSMCSYKAFHKTGLSNHMKKEHHQNRDPIELPTDNEIETWVSDLIEHQTKSVCRNKEDLLKQSTQAKQPLPRMSPQPDNITSSGSASKDDVTKACEEYYYCCPECDFKVKDEAAMKNHLESELDRLRWVCSVCQKKFQQYHEAQFHCKSEHPGLSPRPVQAERDPAKRAAWVSLVIESQKPAIPYETQEETKTTETPATDSLLVVRYEERVPTPEEEMRLKRQKGKAQPNVADDSDNDGLMISMDDSTDDLNHIRKKSQIRCQYCDFTTKTRRSLKDHILKHYNLKPLICLHCGYNCFASTIKRHHQNEHGDLPMKYEKTPIPKGPPLVLDVSDNRKRKDKPDEVYQPREEDGPKVVCLNCEKSVLVSEMHLHIHGDEKPVFRERGQVVVKCCHCLSLVPDESALKEHNDACHPKEIVNYAYHKLNINSRELYCCEYCSTTFTFIRDLKSHHNAVHRNLIMKFVMKPYVHEKSSVPTAGPSNADDQLKRKTEAVEESVKKVAKKSTTKLPGHLAAIAKTVARKSTTKMAVQAIAKKSTTKLPLYVYSDSESGSEEEEFSYYGTKPTPLDDLSNVTTMMTFCNTVMPFTLKKLSEIIKINPIVLIEDIKK